MRPAGLDHPSPQARSNTACWLSLHCLARASTVFPELATHGVPPVQDDFLCGTRRSRRERPTDAENDITDETYGVECFPHGSAPALLSAEGF